MSGTGYIDWQRMDRTILMHCQIPASSTSVYAFWLVDYGHHDRDHGLGLLSSEGQHPDRFLHGDKADHVLAAYTPVKTMVSPNFTKVFDNNLAARPLLAATLLGTSNAIYRVRTENNRLWWAADRDLTRHGKKLIRTLNQLYERDAELVTFIDGVTDENYGPRDPD
jgi:hypothetical protein